MNTTTRLKRMPAEWENPEAILLTLPSAGTDWNYILGEAFDQYRRLLKALADGGERIMLLCAPDAPEDILATVDAAGGEAIRDIPYNDTWIRDYGPLTIISDGAKCLELDFGFNGWGLKFAADRDNLVNLRMAERGYRQKTLYSNQRDYELEGGSVESDGKGTVLTTSRCLLSPNRNGGRDKEDIERILRDRLGAERVLWLDYGFLEGDDTDSHIDTLARLAPEDTILYVGAPTSPDDIHYNELKEMERQLKEFRTAGGLPYRLVPLPFPEAITDEDGNRLPATYANYLVTATNLFIPTYGQPANDAEAVRRIGSAFPNHKVWTVDCRTLIKQHGSLHCSTMQVYR